MARKVPAIPPQGPCCIQENRAMRAAAGWPRGWVDVRIEAAAQPIRTSEYRVWIQPGCLTAHPAGAVGPSETVSQDAVAQLEWDSDE